MLRFQWCRSRGPSKFAPVKKHPYRIGVQPEKTQFSQPIFASRIKRGSDKTLPPVWVLRSFRTKISVLIYLDTCLMWLWKQMSHLIFKRVSGKVTVNSLCSARACYPASPVWPTRLSAAWRTWLSRLADSAVSVGTGSSLSPLGTGVLVTPSNCTLRHPTPLPVTSTKL